MSSKHELLETLRAEQSRWQSLLSALDEAQLTAPRFAENWSIKDVVAHLHQWQQRSNARLAAALDGGEPRYPDWPAELDPEVEGQPNDLNAWLYAQARDQPWSVVYRDWRVGFDRLLDLAAQLPEADLTDAEKYPWLDGYPIQDVLEGTLEHHQEHAEYLQSALDLIGSGGDRAAER